MDRRQTLEKERVEILRRIAEWTPRIEKAGRTSSADYLLPPLAGCAIAVPLFAALAMFAVRNVAEGEGDGYSRQVMMLCVVIFLIIAAITFLVRSRMRTARIAEMRRAQDMAIGMFQQRLREIDAQLREPGPQ